MAHEFELRLEKIASRRLNPQKAQEQVRFIEKGIAKYAPGWRVVTDFKPDPRGVPFGWAYDLGFTVSREVSSARCRDGFF